MNKPIHVNIRYDSPRGPRRLIGLYPTQRAARWATIRTLPPGKARIAARVALRKEPA